MKHLAKFGLVVMLFFSSNLIAQDYQNMPVAVQQKMDENKVNGLHIYDGIEAHFQIELGHLENAGSVNLSSQLENDSTIKSFSLANNSSTLTIISKGNYTIKDIKAHLVNTGASIENYTVTYEVSE